MMRSATLTSRSHSSSSSSPRARRVASICPSAQKIRCISCSRGISREKKATVPPCRATCVATFRTNAVLPMAGRAATMMRSEGWRPRVTLSSVARPVESPVIPPFALASSLTRSTASKTTSFAEINAPVVCPPAMARILRSASSSCSAISSLASYAAPAISVLASIRARRTAFSLTIFA